METRDTQLTPELRAHWERQREAALRAVMVAETVLGISVEVVATDNGQQNGPVGVQIAE